MSAADLPERFWAKVRKSDGCWEWTASRNQKGYGELKVDGSKNSTAHRVSWQLHNGPIPTGLHVLHHCDNPPCIRPDHLFLGTNRDNAQDAAVKGRRASMRGTNNNAARLSPEAARAIRNRVALGAPQRAVAADYGVAPQTVWRIVHGETWVDA